MSEEVVDAVVTWVDSSCPLWQAAREIYAHNQRASLFTPPHNPEAEVELCISLLLRNLPWVRYIWIVTMRPQKPKCILRPEFQGKVRVIHHDEFMEASYLPTFNSCAIEANLWKLPQLSEKFVYVNDDFYVLRPMAREVFFNLDKPIVWVCIAIPSRWKYGTTPYRRSWNNLDNVLPKTRLVHHTPFSLTKQIMEDAEHHFGELWLKTIQSKTRSVENIPPIGAAINLAIQNKHVTIEKVPKTLFKGAVIRPSTLDKLLETNAFFLCVNAQPFDKVQAFCEEMHKRLL